MEDTVLSAGNIKVKETEMVLLYSTEVEPDNFNNYLHYAYFNTFKRA